MDVMITVKKVNLVIAISSADYVNSFLGKRHQR